MTCPLLRRTAAEGLEESARDGNCVEVLRTTTLARQSCYRCPVKRFHKRDSGMPSGLAIFSPDCAESRQKAARVAVDSVQESRSL